MMSLVKEPNPYDELLGAAIEVIESMEDKSGLPLALQRTLGRMEAAIEGVVLARRDSE